MPDLHKENHVSADPLTFDPPVLLAPMAGITDLP